MSGFKLRGLFRTSGRPRAKLDSGSGWNAGSTLVLRRAISENDPTLLGELTLPTLRLTYYSLPTSLASPPQAPTSASIAMSTSTINQKSPPSRGAAQRVWQQVSSALRAGARHVERTAVAEPVAEAATTNTERYLTGEGAGVAGFHPQQATVEIEGIPLIQRLVRESRNYPGPIIEVGTLLGVTTTNMALEKLPTQKIITVDVYCWNPWGLTPDVHAALTSQVLHYLAKTGHVEVVRQDKNDFFREYTGPAPSMVFLDAWHDYEETKKDIAWAKHVGAKIISGHDYCEQFPGVKQAVDEAGGPRELGGSVWVL